jgi:hypothetical protein
MQADSSVPYVGVVSLLPAVQPPPSFDPPDCSVPLRGPSMACACRPARILLRLPEVADEEGRRSSRPAPSLRMPPWRAVLAEVKDWGKGTLAT